MANVRFNAAIACGAVVKLNKSMAAEFKPVLTVCIDALQPGLLPPLSTQAAAIQ